MKLYNTMTRSKEEFVPIVEGEVKMYSCGPTVYNYFHIGNARPFIVFDILRRYFEYQGYKVNFVQNFTDIDDKVINKANDEGVTFDTIADRYIKEYFVDAKGLGVKKATYHPKATDCMDDIIGIVQKLVDTGHAYNVDGDVYFATKSFKDYGKLSHQPLEDLEVGARINVNEQKRDPMDFAVWKSAKPGEPSWNSPWGEGRPGWHIECSAMIEKYLGDTIDIHSGGKDLTFPHHENEVAQSEAAHGCTLANYWVHNGFINVDNTKMSKSLGNFFLVREAAEAYGYETIRMFMLSAHYRTPINYTAEILKQTKSSLDRLYSAKENLQFLSAKAGTLSDGEKEHLGSLDRYKAEFIAAMDDDLNTADAVSSIFELVRDVNIYTKASDVSGEYAKSVLALMMELCDVLGICPDKEEKSLDDEVKAMIEARTEAKRAKDFALADKIRNDLLEMGIEIKDTRDGVQWSFVK